MKKKDVFINFFAVILYLLIILINYISDGNTLINSICLQSVSGIVFFIIMLVKLNGVKNCIQSVEFIYGSIFWVYSIIGSIIFSLDNNIPRYYYFKMNSETMNETLKIYIYIFSIYNLICFIFNKYKIRNIDISIKKMDERVKLFEDRFIIFDLIAVSAMILSLYKLASFGMSFFNLSTLQKREVLNNGFTHYISLYMVVYSMYVIVMIILKSKKNIIYNTRVIIIGIYWGIFLTCERRMFVIFAVGSLMIALYAIRKVKIKNSIIIGSVIVLLSISTALRTGIKFTQKNIMDVVYMSTTEYYCTFSITNAYIVNPPELQYGKTYLYDTFSKFFPRAIFPNKPEDLSKQFKDEYNLKVGFAYNPVAEGILNFGKYVILFLPILLVFITIMANKLGRLNILNYIIIAISSFDFCRGPFSNYCFDLIFMMILAILIFNVNYGEKRVKVE